MYRRFFVVFLSCYAELNLAAANEWNCEKNAAGEWSCETLRPAESAKTQQPSTQKTAQPIVHIVKPKAADTKARPVVDAEKVISPSAVNNIAPPPVAKIKAVAKPELPVKTVETKAKAVVNPAKSAVQTTPTIVPAAANSAIEKVGNTTIPGSKSQESINSAVTIKKEAVKQTAKIPAQPEPEVVVKVQSTQNPVPVSLKTSTAVANANTGLAQDGWTCAPNKENSTWDCNLVGANPKGEVKVVTESEHSLRLVEPAFDANQERAFKSLQKEFPFDPWQQCYAPLKTRQKLITKKSQRDTTPLEIESDYSEVFDKHISNFTGNVEMRRADQHLLADKASYDSAAHLMDTQGNVSYSEDGLALFSNSATLKLAEDKSILRNVLFESISGPFRGSAKVAYKDSKDLSHYHDAAYTSCRPGNQDWVMHTERLKLNRDSGLGSATNTWLEFKGVPIIYTPYINFPIDDRRTSGFLPPSWGRTSRSGFQLSTPFYWNIATNYDAVLKPRYLQRRGVLLAADARYLTEMTKGSAAVEYMPSDELRKIPRYYGSLRNYTTFLPNLTANADLNYISDKNYLYELGSALNISDRRYVKSRASVNYDLEGLAFLAQFERYQTIDDTIPIDQRPYQKLPQLNLDLNHSFETLPIDVAMKNEYVYFYRTGRVSGQRFNTKPTIAFPFSNSGAFITPKLSLQYTQYTLENQQAGLPTSISRATPIASVDTGLVMEQPFEIGDSSFTHTLEPRAFYLYVPRKNQNNLPVFDTALYDFNFASLFRDNRFSGTDRIQDANQLSLALTSRLLDAKTGMEYAKLSVGDIIYFKDRNVILPNYTTESQSFSRIVAELSGTLNDRFSYSTGMQWDPYSGKFMRGNAGIQFVNQGNQVFNLGYLYRREQVGLTVPFGYLDPNTELPANSGEIVSIAQTDVSFRWPVFDDWYLMGRWLYALNFNATKESFIGLEKDSCCWRFSIIGRRFSNALSNTVQSQLQTGIFVQLELKGLGSFGDKVDQFLENNIFGYTSHSKND